MTFTLCFIALGIESCTVYIGSLESGRVNKKLPHDFTYRRERYKGLEKKKVEGEREVERGLPVSSPKQ